LGLQAAAVALFLWFQPLHSWLAIGFLALIWLWFINLYNFMDGIDGITGVETASIGLGIALVASHSDATSGMVAPALCVAAGGIGFLVWNWHPAKVFLGDSGSVPLGLLIGGLLIDLLMQGHWTAALILPGYYWADASLTLAKRLLNGEKIWQAHRKHYYQRAARGDAGPRKVSSTLFLGNLGLVWAAWIAEIGQPGIGLCLGALIVTALLGILRRWGRYAAP
jgi:UDP-N-acetylmuramyl pentapeptide phosphotransferase/UDP-N-acetylglucosamine-1-phosphate transferase